MAIIKENFKKINAELEEKYHVRIDDESISRSTIITGKRKKILIPLIAVARAKHKLEKAEEIREEMQESIQTLQESKKEGLIANEEVNEMVKDISKQKEKIAGEVSQALNYLGKIGTVKNVKIGSASLLVGPWQHWRGFKVRHGGWFKKLLLPYPVLKSIYYRVKNKSKVNENFDEVIKYDDDKDSLKISQEAIDNLAPEKIVETALYGSDEVKYQTVENTDSVPVPTSSDKPKDKDSDYEESFLPDKEEKIAKPETKEEPVVKPFFREDKKEEPIVEEPTPIDEKEENQNNDTISSADALLRDFNREDAKKAIEQYATTTMTKSDEEPVVKPFFREDKKEEPTEAITEEPVVRTEEVKIEEKPDVKEDSFTKAVNNFINEINKLHENYLNALQQIQDLEERNKELEEKLNAEKEPIRVKPRLIKKEDINPNSYIIRSNDFNTNQGIEKPSYRKFK